MDRFTTSDWWKEVRQRVQHSAMDFPAGLDRQTVLNLLAEHEALELVCEPFLDLEPSVAAYRAFHTLFFG